MKKFQILTSIALVSFSGAVSAHELGDVLIRIDGGRLVTGLVDEMGTVVSENERVFLAEFNDPLDPFTIDEPGWQALAGTFQAPALLGFNFTDAFKVWNGSGFQATSGETMKGAFGPLSRTTSAGFVAGFGLAVEEDGSLHDHLAYTLNSPPTDDPSDGIYMLSTEFWTNQSGIGKSETFYVLFNLNRPEEEHSAAAQWVEDNIVPEPGTMAALALGMGYLLRKRTRKDQ